MTKIAIGFLVFTFGAFWGSFLNAVIYRLKNEKNFIKGRSVCPKCFHVLSCFDLIPIFSFILLKGKCRYCSKKISLQYPLVEIGTGIIFLLIFSFYFPLILNGEEFFNFQTFIYLIYLLVVSSFLIIIFVYDLKYFLIPDKVIYPAIVIVFLYRLFTIMEIRGLSLIEGLGWLKMPFWAGLGAGGFFFVIWLISQGRWMGFGDVKLAFFMGFFLNALLVIIALFSAFFIGAIIGLALVVFKSKKMKSEVPFAPFLVAGTFIALFWGQQMAQWYLKLLLS